MAASPTSQAANRQSTESPDASKGPRRRRILPSPSRREFGYPSRCAAMRRQRRVDTRAPDSRLDHRLRALRCSKVKHPGRAFNVIDPAARSSHQDGWRLSRQRNTSAFTPTRESRRAKSSASRLPLSDKGTSAGYARGHEGRCRRGRRQRRAYRQFRVSGASWQAATSS
jgi:hypothetical protein